MERTLTNLRRSKKGDIYIFLRSTEIGERFLRDAEAEGFTIGAAKPTARPYSMIMALHDGRINYVGTNGVIRFQCGGTADFHRVDYEKFVSGAADYGFKRSMA